MELLGLLLQSDSVFGTWGCVHGVSRPTSLPYLALDVCGAAGHGHLWPQ